MMQLVTGQKFVRLTNRRGVHDASNLVNGPIIGTSGFDIRAFAVKNITIIDLCEKSSPESMAADACL